MISGVSHMTFIVQDLDKATEFFQTIFSARIVYDSGSRTFSLSRERFFLVGSLWIVIMEGPSLPEQTYNHIAFQISDGEFEAYKERLTKAGVPMREARSRIPGEGRSLYFYDYDNHLFELHTGTLEERLTAYSRRLQEERELTEQRSSQ